MRISIRKLASMKYNLFICISINGKFLLNNVLIKCRGMKNVCVSVSSLIITISTITMLLGSTVLVGTM